MGVSRNAAEMCTLSHNFQMVTSAIHQGGHCMLRRGQRPWHACLRTSTGHCMMMVCGSGFLAACATACATMVAAEIAPCTLILRVLHLRAWRSSSVWLMLLATRKLHASCQKVVMLSGDHVMKSAAQYTRDLHVRLKDSH